MEKKNEEVFGCQEVFQMAYKLHFLMMILAIFESERFDTNLYYNKSRVAATVVFLLFLKPAIKNVWFCDLSK